MFTDLKPENDAFISFTDLGFALDALISFDSEGINLHQLTDLQQKHLVSCMMLEIYDASLKMPLLNFDDSDLYSNKEFFELKLPIDLERDNLIDITFDKTNRSISNQSISDSQYRSICSKCVSFTKEFYERLMCGYDINIDQNIWSWKESSLTDEQKETLQSIYPNASSICNKYVKSK